MNWKETKKRLIELTGRTFGESPVLADLSGAYLSGAYLSGADLIGADLSGAYLSGADLIGADLSGAYLSGADLSGAYLSGANLRGADLRGADLSRADLQFTDVFAFTAGRHFGFFVPWQRCIKIGCIWQSLEWWLENFEAVGHKNDYSDVEIARYGAIIRMIAELY